MRPSAREFAEFNGLLRSVVEKGLPLPPAIELMAGVVRDRALRDALTGVAVSMKDGAPLPDALSTHPDVFPADYCAAVRAGQESGRLAEVLGASQTHHHYLARVRAKARRLFLYVLIGAVIGELALAITLWAGSHAERVHEQLGISPGRSDGFYVSMTGSGWMLLLVWPASLLLTMGLYHLIQRWTYSGWIGYVLPLWGHIEKSRDLSLFCSTLGLKLRSGASAVDALKSTRDVVRPYIFRRSLTQVIRRVEEGEALSSALFYVKFFPKTLSWGLSLAEENGEVPRTLDTFAGLYTTQMERNFDLLYELMTPLGLLIVGNVALCSAMMILLPILRVQQSLSNF